MTAIYKNIKNILIFILIGVIILLKVFEPKPVDLKKYIKIGGKKYELLSKKIDTLWIKQDTVKIPNYIPTPVSISPIPQPIPVNIDTLAILKDYYAKYFYKDTVKVSKYGNGVINDTISKNKIISRSIMWDLNIPIVKETITIKSLPKAKVFFGGSVGIDKRKFLNNVNVGLLLKTKQDKIYGLNMGLSNSYRNGSSITPYIGISLYWKIKLRRK